MDDFRDLMYDLIIESLVDKLDNYEITIEDAEIFSEAAYDELFYEARAFDRYADKIDNEKFHKLPNSIFQAVRAKDIKDGHQKYAKNLVKKGKKDSDDFKEAITDAKNKKFDTTSYLSLSPNANYTQSWNPDEKLGYNKINYYQHGYKKMKKHDKFMEKLKNKNPKLADKYDKYYDKKNMKNSKIGSVDYR